MLIASNLSIRAQMITSTTHQQLRIATLTAISAAKEVGAARSLPASANRVATTGSTSEVVNVGTAKSLTDVAKKYDVRGMSPRDMAAMSQELYQGGAISFQDHALLSFQPELNPEFNTTLAGTSDPDAPRDFIAQWETQLRIHENLGEVNFAKNDQRMLNILGNLAALHGSAAPA